MDRGLLASLEHIVGRAASGSIGRGAARRGGALDKLRVGLDRGLRANPAHYGLHFELLDALADNARSVVDSSIESLTSLEAIGATEIAPLGPADTLLGDIFRRDVDADQERVIGLKSPSQQAMIVGRDLVARAMSLINLADEFHSDFEEVVRQIVLVEDAPGTAYPFFGGSTFLLWGAVFLNPTRHLSVLDAVDTMVHESSHLVLFAHCMDEPATLNAKTDRYVSPLRADPRPMEGIFHATFVSARMALFYAALAERKDVDSGLEEIQSRIGVNLDAFEQGRSTIRKHGLLTRTGADILLSKEAGVNAIMQGSARQSVGRTL